VISLLILAMFTRTTNISSNVVQHVFIYEIDKCIYLFDILIAKVWPIHPTLIRRYLRRYKLRNYVLDEIHLTNLFNFFITSATTSNSNIEKDLNQTNSKPLIVKI
jgi:hypothetical protein